MSDRDSIDSPAAAVEAPKKVKSRRPPNTAFRQQRLKAWQPILTPKTVLPLFFGTMALFALFGGLLIHASQIVKDVELDYTHCIDIGSSYEDMPSGTYTYSSNLKHSSVPQWRTFTNDSGTYCDLKFQIDNELGKPLYMFYKLTNFYQNHRRYVLSYNEDQLQGKPKTASELESADDCSPLITDENGKPYYPCGLIANSLFNDTFGSPVNFDTNAIYDMTNNGIAWSSDSKRFKKTSYNASDVAVPKNWVKRFPNGYNDDNLPDISQWPEFQNWMRTAALPTFSKLALRNDNAVMPAGTWVTTIGLNFDTTAYDGKKSVLYSTRSAIGGRNNFLGIAYLVVAGLCAILGLAFLIQHLVKPRRLGDHTYLSWNQPHQDGSQGTTSSMQR